MFDFNEKRKIRGLLYSKFSIGILLVLVVWMSVVVYGRFTVEREMNQKRLEKEEDLRVLQERAAALEAKVTALEDERGIEEELRRRFDVAKEGEQVVIIVDENEASLKEVKTDDAATSSQLEKKSWWSWLRFW